MPSNNEGAATFAEGTFKSDWSLVERKCEQIFFSNEKTPPFKLYKGLFSATASELAQNIKTNAAIINVDSDLYQSTCEAFSICIPLIQVGTVLLLDDYNAYRAHNAEGQRRAFGEFQEKTRLKFEKWCSYYYVGQAFLCVAD
ncbi:MAG: hypothetical protein EXQ85_06510 [Alphaproteobacteria bacterium]|nr:hypothetical protein [Alphaproteobacteria bacterium]